MATTARSGLIAAMVAADVTKSTASRNCAYEVARFPDEDVKAILAQLSAVPKIPGSSEPCGPKFNIHNPPKLGLKMSITGARAASVAAMLPAQLAAAAVLAKQGKYEAIRKEIPTATANAAGLFSNLFTFVKADVNLVQQAVIRRQALCVNRAGKFQLMTSGYVVCSHVWGETMGWKTPTSWGAVELSVRKKGMSLEHLERIIDRCDAEWIWLDVVAMPEVLEDMTEAEKHRTTVLRNGVINTLYDVYSKADGVAVLDSLCLRLSTGSMVDVAVIFCLGLSMTRLWNFTESRLAKRVLIKTADSSFDLDEIISFLKSVMNNDTHRYWNLLARLEPLRPTPAGSDRFLFFSREQHDSKHVPMLHDVFHGTENRDSQVEVDHARVLFPLLQLRWQDGWTVGDGFRCLLQRFPDEQDVIKRYFDYRQHCFASVKWLDICNA